MTPLLFQGLPAADDPAVLRLFWGPPGQIAGHDDLLKTGVCQKDSGLNRTLMFSISLVMKAKTAEKNVKK